MAKEPVQIGLVLGLGFLLRLLNLLAMRQNSPFFDMPATDALFYDELAQNLAAGNWLGDAVFHYNPLYPYFLGLCYAVFGHSYLIPKLIQIVMGTSSCLLLYLVSKRLFGHAVALIAGLMAAVYGTFIFFDELLLATSLSVFLFLATTLLLLRAASRPTVLRCVLAGLVLGVTFVARPSFLPFIAFGWLLFQLRHQGKRIIVTRLGAMTVAASLMVLPVTVRNYVVGADFVLVSAHSGYNLYLGNHIDSQGYFTVPRHIPRTLVDEPADQKTWFTETAEADVGRTLKPSEVSSYWSHKAFEHITENFGEWLALLGRKAVRLINEHEYSDNQDYDFSKRFSWVLSLPLLTFWMVLPLGVLGMVLARRDFGRLSFLYLFVAIYAGGLMIFFISTRYRIPLVPFLMVFAAYAVHRLAEDLRQRHFGHVAKSAVLIGVVLWLSFADVGAGSRKGFFIDYYNMGNKFMKKEQYDKAIAAYESSLAINRSYLSSLNNLASAYELNGQTADAIRTWKALLTLAEKKGSAMHVNRARGRIRLLSGDPPTHGNKPPKTR